MNKLAQLGSLDDAPGVNLTFQNVINIVMGLTCWFISMALIMIVISVVFYGIRYILSRGDATKVGEAKKGLGWAVVGTLVILGAYSIMITVAYAIGNTNFPSIPLQC